MKAKSAFIPMVLAFATACATTAADKPLPAFPVYRPAPDSIFLLARGYARLALRGRCLGMTYTPSHFSTIAWPDTARLGRDSRGLFVADTQSGARLRLGDWFTFGSGRSDGQSAYGNPLLVPAPPECRVRVTAIHPGFKKSRRP